MIIIVPINKNNKTFHNFCTVIVAREIIAVVLLASIIVIITRLLITSCRFSIGVTIAITAYDYFYSKQG